MPRFFTSLIIIVVFSSRHVAAQPLAKAHTTGMVVQTRPNFFLPQPQKIADTTFEFEVYDRRDSVMQEDTLADFSAVKYITLWQKYLDPLHTYKDKNGTQQLLPIAKIRHRYDKTGSGSWMKIDYLTRKMTQVKELEAELGRRDTLPERIIQYYKTGEQQY